MNDAALAEYLGISDYPDRAAIIARIPPERRASYERMATLEVEIEQWLAGIRPRPKFVLIDLDERRAIFQ